MLRNMGSDAPDTVLADIGMRLLDHGMAMGFSRPQLLKILGVEDHVMRNPMARIPVSALLRLTTAMEQPSGNKMLGLKMAERLSPQCFSDLGYPVFFAPNLGSIFRLFCTMQPYYQNALCAEFTIDGQADMRLSFRAQHAKTEVFGGIVEWLIAGHIGMGTKMIGAPLRLKHIGFAHKPRYAEAYYQQYFGCHVHFNQPQSYILLHGNDAYRPAIWACPKLFNAALNAHNRVEIWQQAGKQHLANAYIFCLLQLNRKPVSLERFALAFGYSERSMRRALMEEGMPFRQILDKVRQVLFSLYQMEGKLSLGEIAAQLGYSELSALSRAQRRWHQSANVIQTGA
jgi:AraC-like DNA-binding protein